MNWKINPANEIKGTIAVPPDKSISHRAVMFGAISKGSLKVGNFLTGEDCMSTLSAFKAMGVPIEVNGDILRIKGVGLKGLKAPEGRLYLGNSGTSMRIIAGILAGQEIEVILTGDESLSGRPMKRVIEPLAKMGARIDFLEKEGFAPFIIKGAKAPLKPIAYSMPIASAQVKSSVLAAGLYADGVTSVTEPFISRDHTERILELFGADIRKDKLTVSVNGLKELEPKDIVVPGDISSAAFFLVGALLAEKSDLLLKGVGLNPTRTGILDVLLRMGADVRISDIKKGPEPYGDIRVKNSHLKGTVVAPSEIPLLIDEIPVLMVAAAMASGETVIRGISELKVKETDRIKSMGENLLKAGIEIISSGDDVVIPGGRRRFEPSRFISYGDHRTAMSMAIASLFSSGESIIDSVDCVATSYPGFLEDLTRVVKLAGK
ncbi:MAG: 3-phosphoshikimate 1-carboxyvinyltransferase [Candidatus Omnitrophica bacterium]|nr:3-phosphoshikimate 1-carboxyvinyltransferase [Candidatus Omnitrophota bacterium]